MYECINSHVFMSCVFLQKMSDHKPVHSLFEVDVKRVIEEKKDAVGLRSITACGTGLRCTPAALSAYCIFGVSKFASHPCQR